VIGTEASALAAIAAMAIVTYATRLGGLVLMPRLPSRTWIGYVPGCVLAAIVAPALLKAGLPGLAAGALAIVLARRTSNLLVPLAAAVAVVWLLRSLT
jgi:branched chain amino acid efflux pump